MMCRSSSIKGFSLIELIVVMAIMAVLMSLSGGLFQKSINQQERHVELEKVNQLFRKLSYEAYYGGKLYNVRLEKNLIQISNSIKGDEGILIEYLFNQLTFVAQNYAISSKGIVTPNVFGIIGPNSIKSFTLATTFNEQ